MIFGAPEGSLSATTVVVVLLTRGVVTRFRKMPKAFNCSTAVRPLVNVAYYLQ